MKQEWYRIPVIRSVPITKNNTNKIYVKNKISKTSQVSVWVSKDGCIGREIPIKNIRSKSIVLKEKLTKDMIIYVAYYYWAICTIVNFGSNTYNNETNYTYTIAIDSSNVINNSKNIKEEIKHESLL